jgi:hypothetical protein
MFAMVWTAVVSVRFEEKAYTNQQLLLVTLAAFAMWVVGALNVLKFGGNRHTFSSTLTSLGLLEETFALGNDDSIADLMFMVNKDLIGPKLKVDIQMWIDKGWVRWCVEKPVWFTDEFKDKFGYYGYSVPAVVEVRRRRSSGGTSMRGGGGSDGSSASGAGAGAGAGGRRRRASFLRDEMAKQREKFAPRLVEEEVDVEGVEGVEGVRGR